MLDENTPDPARMLEEAQWLVLNTLCRSGGRCSIGELALAVGDDVLTGVALAALHAVGLVSRLGPGFVCATPAALRAHELERCALRLVAGELRRRDFSPRPRSAVPVRRQRRRMACRALKGRRR